MILFIWIFIRPVNLMAKNLVQLCSKYRILVYICMYHYKTYAYVSWVLLRLIWRRRIFFNDRSKVRIRFQISNSYSRLYIYYHKMYAYMSWILLRSVNWPRRIFLNGGFKVRILILVYMYHHKAYAYVSWVLLRLIW